MVYRDPVNGWNSTDGLNSFSGEWGQLIRRMGTAAQQRCAIANGSNLLLEHRVMLLSWLGLQPGLSY
jgi:hypothetical protein